MPVAERLRHRFGIKPFCIAADRWMSSTDTISRLEEHQMPYILGTRMPQVKVIKTQILTRTGRYKEVYPENADRRRSYPF